jgi:hypothetical protein
MYLYPSTLGFPAKTMLTLDYLCLEACFVYRVRLTIAPQPVVAKSHNLPLDVFMILHYPSLWRPPEYCIGTSGTVVSGITSEMGCTLYHAMASNPIRLMGICALHLDVSVFSPKNAPNEESMLRPTASSLNLPY